MISVGLWLAWLTSFKQNRDLIAQNERPMTNTRLRPVRWCKQTVIDDRESAQGLPLLHRLRNTPVGYGNTDSAYAEVS